MIKIIIMKIKYLIFLEVNVKMPARIKFDLTSKFSQMLNDWAGRTATKISVTETIDEQGNVIDRTEVETEIIALIGNPSTNTNISPPGIFQTGDLCGYFKVADDLVAFEQLTQNTTRHDLVKYEDVTYRTELIDVIFDVDEKSITVMKMKKIAI